MSTLSPSAVPVAMPTPAAAPSTRRRIDPGLSLYLDLVRFLAAVSVVLHHVWELLVPAHPLPWPGHACVVVFFVLSGYVIAYTSDRADLTWGAYARQRAARILSVAFPALLLAIAIAPFVSGPNIPNAGPMEIAFAAFVQATVVNALFIGQSFGLNQTPPYNPPFWSISYEVWYYVIFGVWYFAAKRMRLLLVLAACALAGFKILMLMPVWLLGVFIYRWSPKLSVAQAWTLFIASGIALAAYYWIDVSVLIRSHLAAAYPEFVLNLRGSNQFVGDFLFGLLVALNFAAVPSMGRGMAILFTFAKPIRYLSGFTFSIYLYHMPLVVLIYNGLGIRSAPVLALMLIAGIVVLGYLTERRADRLRLLLERWTARPARLRAQ